MHTYRKGDVGDWVEQRDVPVYVDHDTAAPSTYSLVDYQDRVSDKGIERYCRTVEWINDESRVEDASLLLHELNDQQEVVFHHVRVIRDGKVADVLDLQRVALNERQRGLESHVVDGIRTVSYSIEDLRVGDAIDYAYTIVAHAADHPIHGRYYLANRWLSWAMPVKAQFIRLINDSSSPVRRYVGRYKDKSFSSEQGLIECGCSYELALSDLPITQVDASVPPWFWPDFCVLASAHSWAEVSQQLLNGLHLQHGGDAAIELSEIVDIGGLATEQAIIQLLRFVQNEVRYRSESSGIFSHTPKPASRTLQARHGDCKDKTVLLQALLRQIGVASDPVLVSTELSGKIAELPASPLWFDHMVLRIRHQGREYFVDPTIKKQGGDLQHLADLPYAYALPLHEGGSELLALPSHPEEQVFELHHVVDFSCNEVDHYRLIIRRVFHRHRADNMRYFLSSKSAEILANEFLGYARDELDVGLSIEKPLAVTSDDLDANRLETLEQYRIDGLGPDDDNRTLGIATDHYRSFPVSSSLDYPLQHELDGVLLHKLDVLYRLGGSAAGESTEISNQWFKYRDKVTSSKNGFHFRSETRPGRRFVAARDLKTYLQDVESMRKRSVNSFPFRTHQVEWTERLGKVMGLLAIIAFAIGLLVTKL